MKETIEELQARLTELQSDLARIAAIGIEHPETAIQLRSTLRALADAARDVRNKISQALAEENAPQAKHGENPEPGLSGNT